MQVEDGGVVLEMDVGGSDKLADGLTPDEATPLEGSSPLDKATLLEGSAPLEEGRPLDGVTPVDNGIGTDEAELGNGRPEDGAPDEAAVELEKSPLDRGED